MKQALVLFIVIFFCCSSLQAQPYQSMFANGDGNTAWIVRWSNLFGKTADSIYVEKDTTVNNVQYKKIKFTAAPHLIKGALLREDVNTGYVWYRETNIKLGNPDDTVERIAFRFDLNVGDTFDISNAELPAGTYPDSFNVVDSIRFISGLKHIYFKGKYSAVGEPYTIIEGVGSNVGIFWKTLPPSAMLTPYLLCSYKSDFKTAYENKLYNGSCTLPANIDDINVSKNNIEIYPQPAKDKIYIRNNTNQKIIRVQIISQTGMLVKQSSQSLITSIEIDSIPAGYYFIKLFTTNGYLTTKPMIIR